MTYTEKTISKFFEQLDFEQKLLSVDSYETLLENSKSFFDSYAIVIQKKCDYWNDSNEDGDYYCDLASERADSIVDIYTTDLWKKAPLFKDYTEEALDEFGYDNQR